MKFPVKYAPESFSMKFEVLLFVFVIFRRRLFRA